jgi:hypothetical protein
MSADIERVLIQGDLSRLTPDQRVSYYQAVCKSLGLNPLTKPFDFINLNGKLTLYAKKDAADQLRKINGVSIDDVDVRETDTQFVVKAKGHDVTGRADVEIGVVNKSDMRGDTANAQMKAVTKAKRRLTLSLCGLGWLDETEVETIPDARPVAISETGEILPDPAARFNGAGKLYQELVAEAAQYGIVSEPLESFATRDDLVAAGKELRAAVQKAKESNAAES